MLYFIYVFKLLFFIHIIDIYVHLKRKDIQTKKHKPTIKAAGEATLERTVWSRILQNVSGSTNDPIRRADFVAWKFVHYINLTEKTRL